MANEPGIGFLQEVKTLFHGKRREYDEFIKDIHDFKTWMNHHPITRLKVQEFKQRVNKVLKGDRHLILVFNTYINHHAIKLPIPLHHHDDQQRGHKTGKKKKKVAENCQLPWILLDIISTMLDFDELFRFGSVCKSWREFHKIYWSNFMASQEPLLVQRSSAFNKSFSFISLPHHKVYHSKMINNLFLLAYQGSSSGYLIMTRTDNSFILINPFTRRKMIINNPTFKVVFSCFSCQVLLAFFRGSKEFVLVVLCEHSDNLQVYQSRNLGWVTYSTPQKVVNFVILHNTIYVVTDKILNLNSANINFLELKSTPSVTSTSYLHVRLVSCDGHLLVLNIMSKVTFNVYKIDFSTMDYVKLETLGDIALFYAPRRRYYALSNPRMWGYENNYVHVIDLPCDKYRVYKGDDNKMPELILPIELVQFLHPGLCHLKQPYLDWCFKHLRYEID